MQVVWDYFAMYLFVLWAAGIQLSELLVRLLFVRWIKTGAQVVFLMSLLAVVLLCQRKEITQNKHADQRFDPHLLYLYPPTRCLKSQDLQLDTVSTVTR